MTTKVVKGSLWTLGGQVLPMAVALIATPFTIRFLGSEGYGVVILVGLIPTYFSAAEFGMTTASTKFASEAFGRANFVKEGEIVWTAASIATLSSLLVTLPLFFLSSFIIKELNVPENLQMQASIALKLTSVAFVFGNLSTIFNSPMLSRLRMDLNTFTSAGPKILLSAVTPFILYFGGGIVGAVSWAFIVTITTLVVVFFLSGRLLPGLFQPRINTQYLRPLLKFGGATMVATFASMLLGNSEKLVLTKFVSVQALAHYSIAFTFANLATMFALAMLQSLIPAFSQIATPEKSREFDDLFSRSMRLTLIWALPTVMVLFVIAKPFFSLWAGEEYGRESTIPLYFLLIGFIFGLLAFVPVASITAFGRQDIFVKLYWIELPIYLVIAVILVNALGIVGAALAWSIRVMIDSIILRHMSARITGHSFRLASAALPLLFPIASLIP